MANTVVTDEQIYEFLKYLVNLVPTLYVDDKGFPRKKSDGEPIYTGTNVESKIKKPLILYGSPHIDNECVILNPFIEGMTKSAESDWFYTVLVVGTTNYVRWIEKSFLLHGQSAKNKKKAEAMDLELASIISPWVDKVDETMQKEFDILTNKMSDYFNIYYLPRKREARVRCGLIDDKDFRIAHKKIRGKTWDTLTAITKQIFDTENFSEYTVVSKLQGCPQFDAILRICLKLFTMMNRYLKYIPEEVRSDMNVEEFDLDYLSTSIDLLDHFRAKAKYIVPTATPTTTIPVNQPNPVAQIQPTIGIPGYQVNPMNAYVGMPGQPTMPFANIPAYPTGMPSAMPMQGVGIPGNAVSPLGPMVGAGMTLTTPGILQQDIRQFVNL